MFCSFLGQVQAEMKRFLYPTRVVCTISPFFLMNHTLNIRQWRFSISIMGQTKQQAAQANGFNLLSWLRVGRRHGAGGGTAGGNSAMAGKDGWEEGMR